MISTLGLVISRVFRRTCPDPFILAIALTLLTGVLVMAFGGSTLSDGTVVGGTLFDAIRFWQDGFWELLTFSMQMCLILITGHALASSPPLAWAIRKMAGLPRSALSATALVASVAMVLGVINWGLGLIAGALIARHVGKSLDDRNVPHHYPLLAAAGYLGLLVWHGGFSGSAPLKVTNAGEVQEIFQGIKIDFETIPFDHTILSPMNLLITGGLILVALVTIVMLVPRDEQSMQGYGEFEVEELHTPARQPLRTLPDWLEATPIFSVLLAVPMLFWLADLFVIGDDWPIIAETRSWKQLTPNDVNLLFLALGLLMHGTPRRYVGAVNDAVRGCSGIILQFPLYAGIMGMMKYSHLTELFAQNIASVSNETTLPVTTFLSAGVVNLFVPSGGGQWAVQGPIAMQAASEIGVSYPKIVMAVAYGDQLTNMLQPFWALPLLGITGVKARDIVGYTTVVMIFAAIWIALGLLLF
ncbi:MAG: TIGR00366 family protein [Planctomycetota bacterium]|nr:TIGR00366 family protein [Planctomycetota bacterium]